MNDIFLPKLYVDSITEITADMLEKNDIKGLILDIDNTLVPNHVADADDDAVRWIESMKASGFAVHRIERGKKRVVRFNEKLKLFAIYRAMKPARKAFLKAGGLMGLENRQIAVVIRSSPMFTAGAGQVCLPYLLSLSTGGREVRQAEEGFERRVLRGIPHSEASNCSEERTDGT